MTSSRWKARNQNITVGVSFGAERELAFLHAKTGHRAYFPQVNGTVQGSCNILCTQMRSPSHFLRNPFRSMDIHECLPRVRVCVRVYVRW